ncbi:MAG: DNA-processing protein DprA [Anaerolineae bacterium]|jgi:predicted Rossmann fold nucleotide-binding protein DprA/Smf involved in DNA uptake|nr:DNA-processing protein DprA [Anaerolineae bacterium]
MQSNSQIHRLTSDAPDYPAALLRTLGAEAPPWLDTEGNLALLHTPTLGLVCSAKAPGSILLHVHDLAQQWRTTGPTLVSGFHSPAEQEVLAVLLRGPQTIILCPARSLLRMRLKPEYREPLAEGRLLLLSPFPEYVQRATAETALQRNRLVAALADALLVAHAEPEGKTAHLVQEIASWGKPLYTLDHPSNAHLGLPHLVSRP